MNALLKFSYDLGQIFKREIDTRRRRVFALWGLAY